MSIFCNTQINSAPLKAGAAKWSEQIGLHTVKFFLVNFINPQQLERLMSTPSLLPQLTTRLQGEQVSGQIFYIYQQGCTKQQSLFFKFDEGQTFSFYVPQHLAGKVSQKQMYSSMEAGALISAKSWRVNFSGFAGPTISVARVLKPFVLVETQPQTICKQIVDVFQKLYPWTETEISFKVHMSGNIMLLIIFNCLKL